MRTSSTRGSRAPAPTVSPGVRSGSAGLGLAIVGTVVAAHGGHVGVEPTDAGCLFEVRLPAGGPVLQDDS